MMAMDESTNRRHAGEVQPADADSQAAEPRGRLGRHEDQNATVDNHRDDGDGRAAGQADRADQRDPDDRDPDDERPPDEKDGGVDAHGSSRSFLLGQAWWP
jgi:hypothetical protein